LNEAEYKSNGLINLPEESSRQHSILASMNVLAVFSQIYSENKEQKNRVKRFGKCVIWPEKMLV
jgi:hypothetical protein